MKDAQIALSGEECALSTEQRSNDVALKDAQINPNGEEYVGDTELTAATPPTNLLLFHHILGQSLRRLLQHLATSVIWQLKRIQQARIVYLKRWSSVELLQKILRRSKVWRKDMKFKKIKGLQLRVFIL